MTWGWAIEVCPGVGQGARTSLARAQCHGQGLGLRYETFASPMKFKLTRKVVQLKLNTFPLSINVFKDF